MKNASKIFLCFFFILLLSIFSNAKELIIFMGEKEVGRETFVIKQQEKEIIIESSIKIDLPIQNLVIKQNCKLVYEEENYIFKNYESTFSAGHQFGKIKSENENNKIKTTAISGMTPLSNTIDYKKNTIILDNNYFSHFCIINNMIDFSKNEEVNLNIFSPAVMNYFPALVKIKNDFTVRIKEEEIVLKSIMLFTPLYCFSIFLNEDKEVVCIVDYTNNIKAVSQEFKDVDFNIKKEPVKPPENVIEEEVEFKSGEIKLSGSLTRPKKFDGKLPAFVLVSGSGPQDRNGNVTISSDQLKQFEFLEWSGPEWNIFNVIAFKLSSLGYVVLRYDDRGVGKSGGSFSNTKLSDFISDVESAVRFLRERKEVDNKKIILIGHSEGAMIAPKVATNNRDIYAILLMAVPSDNLIDVIIRQSEERFKELGLNESMIKLQMNQIKSNLKKTIESKDEWIEIQEQKVFTLWLKEHANYNILNTLCEVKCPVVIFQGKKDKQVYPDYAEKIEKSFKEKNKNNLTVKYFENLDHLFMESRGWTSEYFDPDRKISEEFLKALCDVCEKLLKF